MQPFVIGKETAKVNEMQCSGLHVHITNLENCGACVFVKVSNTASNIRSRQDLKGDAKTNYACMHVHQQTQMNAYKTAEMKHMCKSNMMCLCLSENITLCEVNASHVQTKILPIMFKGE